MQIDEYPVPNECARAQVYLLLPVLAVDDDRISDGEVLLLAEIMALSNNTGYCYASNAYLMKKRRISQSTLTSRLGNLKKHGYIKVELIKDDKGCVKERRIYPYCLDFTPYTERPGEVCRESGIGYAENLATPMPKSRQENNINTNNISKNKRESTREARPNSIEDVRAYCRERNNRVNVEKWYAHYESIGWKVGRNPMKDWKAAIRKWEADDGCGPQPKGGTPSNGTSITDGFV